MTRIPLMCRSATTFTTGRSTEMHWSDLQRLVDCGHGVYLASGASATAPL